MVVLIIPMVLGQEMDIIGDGTGAKVRVDVVGGKITNTVVTTGGKGYTYAMVDLGKINSSAAIAGTTAHLIPIIPPSKVMDMMSIKS